MDDLSLEPLPVLAPRKRDSHKGDFGRVIVVGGSRGMSGAVTLAGVAALRSGAGLVTLAVPESIQAIVAGYEPSLMTHALAESAGALCASIADVERVAAGASAVGVGPGIGRDGATQLVCGMYKRLGTPLVVDADALTALAAHDATLEKPGGPRVLTPHPGEFRRLMRTDETPAGDEARRDAARGLACRDPTGNLIVVLKGHRTIVCDGRRYSVNTTGNPGMATGGSGDVLTGVITALVAQGMAPFDAARLGVYIHGLAGDLAAAELGQCSLIASDLLKYLPAAFKQYESGRA
jgi:NAD(P)H-hydrate epimerase